MSCWQPARLRTAAFQRTARESLRQPSLGARSSNHARRLLKSSPCRIVIPHLGSPSLSPHPTGPRWRVLVRAPSVRKEGGSPSYVRTGRVLQAFVSRLRSTSPASCERPTGRGDHVSLEGGKHAVAGDDSHEPRVPRCLGVGAFRLSSRLTAIAVWRRRTTARRAGRLRVSRRRRAVANGASLDTYSHIVPGMHREVADRIEGILNGAKAGVHAASARPRGRRDQRQDG